MTTRAPVFFAALVGLAAVAAVPAAPRRQEGPTSPRESPPPTAESPQPAPEGRPAITLQSVSSDRLKVNYLNIPWGPNTFAAMERPGDSFYNRRDWPFARLELNGPVTLEGSSILPGNYALVFHPNTPDDQGMSLELRRIKVPEFLEPGNAFTPTPDGESVWRGPIRFDTARGSSPHLKIELAPRKDGVSLIVNYGNRRLVKDFDY